MEDFFNVLKFDDKGLVSVIVRDVKRNTILMLAHANAQAISMTIETGKAHYFSRSRNKIWLKGETSGNFQQIKGIDLDCDGDAVIYHVEQTNHACHTGTFTCFRPRFTLVEGKLVQATKTEPSPLPDGQILQQVYDIVSDRLKNPDEKSYTTYLFTKGIDKILKKVGEESAEVIIAAKNGSRPELIGEVSDLMYHLIVTLVETGIDLQDIYAELRKRRKMD